MIPVDIVDDLLGIVQLHIKRERPTGSTAVLSEFLLWRRNCRTL